MQITRRTLLGTGTVAGVGLLLPLRMTTSANAAIPAGVTPFTEPLPTLTELGIINATTGTSTAPATATIEMVNATHNFYDGIALGSTPTFTYRTVSVGGVAAPGAQDYLGPVIVAKQDAPFELTVVNNLGAHPLASAIDDGIMGVVPADATAPRAAVHLHGGNTEAASDGDPMDFFGFGGTKTYNYGNTQEAAGLWYHDHALGITRLNVFAGLAGGYVLRSSNADDDGSGTRLPAYLGPTANYEVPLVIQDRMFNPNGSFLYPINPGPFNPDPMALRNWMPEFFGDVATVNGKIMPRLDVARGKYRFRVYNGSQARFYNFKFKTSLLTTLPFFQIGTDGGLLNAPVPLTKLVLGPGERADLVVDFAALLPGTTVVLANDAPAPYPNGPRALVKGGAPLPQIMRFTVTSATGWTAPLPAVLRTTAITRLAGLPTVATRNITLVEIFDPVYGPVMALMNNRRFEEVHVPAEPTLTVKSNTLEQWNFINTTGDAHPMHLHFAQFQLLNRQLFDVAGYMAFAGYPVGPAGGPPLLPSTGPASPPAVPASLLRGRPMAPAANEMGWKDTVMALPGQVTRILVPFGANPAGVTGPMAIGANHTGRYVSHCHILEHEENDMMMRYIIN